MQMLKDLSVIIVTLISEPLRRKSHCTRIRICQILFFPWKVQYYGVCCNEGLDQGHCRWKMRAHQDQLRPFFGRFLCSLCQPCSSWCVITVRLHMKIWRKKKEIKQWQRVCAWHVCTVQGLPIRLRGFSLFCVCPVRWLPLSLVHRPVFFSLTKHQRTLHSFGIRACPSMAFVRTDRREPHVLHSVDEQLRRLTCCEKGFSPP